MDNNTACYSDAIKFIADEYAAIEELYESPIISPESLSSLTYWKHAKINGMIDLVFEIFGKSEEEIERDIRILKQEEVA